MQIKLSVLLIVLVFIFVVFHYYSSTVRVNPPVIYRPPVRDQRYHNRYYSPEPEQDENFSGTTPLAIGYETDANYGPETGFTSTFIDNENGPLQEVVYSDGTPMEEVTPLY